MNLSQGWVRKGKTPDEINVRVLLHHSHFMPEDEFGDYADTLPEGPTLNRPSCAGLLDGGPDSEDAYERRTGKRVYGMRHPEVKRGT